MGDRNLVRRERDADPDAGGDVPTPESVFGFIRDVNRAVDLAAIADHFDLKPEQIASQVDVLCEGGLVVKCLPGRRRSRRTARYAAAIADAATPETQDAYFDLSELLLGVLVGGRAPDEVGRMAGRQLGKAVARNDSSKPDDTVAQLQRLLESRGFRPTQVGTRPNVGFVLGRCPFEKAALTNPAVVCGLHRALAEGMVEALGGAFEVTNLVARDPRTAGCRLELRSIRQRV